MNISQVILGPVVTEKAMQLAEHNQYAMYIHSNATKTDVKTAIHSYYGVRALDVNIIKMPIKIRVRSKNGPQIKRKGRTKAIVRVASGKNLDLLKMLSPPKKSDNKPSVQ